MNHDIFYDLLNKLENLFPKRTLSQLTSKELPEQGVYFFFETNEKRQESNELRVVRVGTHAAQSGSKATLYDRLSKHRGTVKGGGGKHRSSVQRELIGDSFINKLQIAKNYPNWAIRSHKSIKETLVGEIDLEIKISNYIVENMPFISLAVPGKSGKDNLRSYIEKNSIALLSNYEKTQKVNPPSRDWLGYHSSSELVKQSGLWNRQYVNLTTIDGDFYAIFEELISKMQ